MARKTSDTEKLARFFVTEILGREWTPADYRGMHMKHAKTLLKDYDLIDLVRCLCTLRDGVLGEWMAEAQDMLVVVRGEPPLINEWTRYKAVPPPVWQERPTEYWQWITRYDPF